ncbi:DUF4348 domain-containing protein [Prevotella corporis]|uniref:DUF4348 domain-containing protein n=1 Tax=Prevotella corporis TaxID=28128 RepID=UPI0023F2EC2D|nr:DUF4348 domain-containing protein [Prevotella corporis]MDQ7737603.1 DUF4348 domain-containing protein [Prevotella corporis]
MRKSILFVVIICAAMVAVTTGCTNKKPESVDTPSVDSVAVDTADTVDSTTAIIAETPMPKAADQLFDDFFFNFIANKKLQRARIKFPLPVTTNGKCVQIERNAWKTDHFFRPQGYYTLIFDDEKQAELAKSTDLDTVIVEKIFLRKGLVEQYCFDHQDGSWKMHQIKNVGFSSNHNASFLKFLQKFFAGKSLSNVKNPLPYSGPDPNNEDASNVNTTIPAGEWSSFLPEVPGDMIYNILYGQKYKESNKKILTFRGLSNGVETQLVFKKKGNSWKLVKIYAY